MNKIKVKLDREKLSSNYIESKQDFKEVTSQVHASNVILKSTWFYGGIGLASLATIVTLSVKTLNPSSNENNNTLNASISTASFLNSQGNNNSNETNVTSTFSKKTKVVNNQVVDKKVLKLESSNKASSRKKSIPVNQFDDKLIETSPVVKNSEAEKQTVVRKNYMPKIDGIYNGEIKIQQLCNSGIEVNDEVEIISFTLNYSTNRGDKTVKMNGKRVPDYVCNEMQKLGIDQMIFILDIVGKNSEGELLRIVPMNLTATIE